MLKLLGTIRHRQEEGSGPDVNTSQGFTEALITAGGGELTPEAAAALAAEPDRSVAGGLTTESQNEPERDESGRFAAKPEPAATPAEPAEGAAPEQEPAAAEPSPLEKQLQDSQAFIGEQGRLLGEERAKREALEQRLSALEAGTQEEPGQYIPDEEAWGELTDLFDQIGGPGMMARVAASDPEQIDAAMSLWKAGGDTEVAAAYLYEAQVNQLIADQQGSATPAAPELPEEVKALAAREKMNGVLSEVVTSLGERAPAIAPHITPALEALGPLAKQAIGTALASGNTEQQKAAFEEIVSLAEARANGNAAVVAQEQKQTAAVEAKRAAQVATGSGRPAVAAGESDTPASREEFEQLPPEQRKTLATKLVADQFAKTETTSVRDGLTFGPTQ